jgi:hypothetical protein
MYLLNFVMLQGPFYTVITNILKSFSCVCVAFINPDVRFMLKLVLHPKDSFVLIGCFFLDLVFDNENLL